MPEFRHLDAVALLTTKHITYLSGPTGISINPSGIWAVAGAVGDQLLLTKDSTVIRVPPTDVRLIQSFSLDLLEQQLKGIINGEIRIENITKTEGIIGSGE